MNNSTNAPDAFERILDFKIDLKEWYESLARFDANFNGEVAIGDILDGNLFDEMMIVTGALEHPKAAVGSIRELQTAVHQNAVDHGWWEAPRSFGEIVALIHSELSEALEEHRAGKPMNQNYYLEGNPKPEGVPSELADAVIRVLDACEYYGIDLEAAIREKHEYNKTRPYRHGG